MHLIFVSVEALSNEVFISMDHFPHCISPEYMDYDICLEIFKEAKILYAEPLFQGTYEECLDYPIKFETLLPSKLGFAWKIDFL